MQITKELLDREIAEMSQGIENLKAKLAQAVGGLSVFQGLRAYLDKEEPKKEEEAEDVPVAPVVSEPVVEEQEALPSAAEIWEQEEAKKPAVKVVDGNGKYS